MSIMDGFMFWIGRTLADLAVGAAIVVFFMLCAAIVVWITRDKP